MHKLERANAKESMHLPPYKVTASEHLRLFGRRKKAQLFRCKRGASNAVNAYPMPNRHEIPKTRLSSQLVRIRHIGRHKYREPAIAEEIRDLLRV
ncbi:hypothetical protein PS691_03540 [Pseudomonas fluorescens]|uniref:Uncharacterized protein n=1 Tax=Pseudomonas fluorescens TaxID=294 RepID=A0A5E7D5Z5_PSEFL|nr:hypothetical protein PS691_03540 [Pseudomonas fluorescens]